MGKIEDAVVQAMMERGLSSQVPDEMISPDVQDSIQPTEDEETQNLIAEIMVEFVRKQRVSFAQLAHMRRVFKRILLHLSTQKQACTMSSIRNTIDPRYRKQVPIIVQEMTKHGLLSPFDDDTSKTRWTINHKYKAQAILYAMEK